MLSNEYFISLSFLLYNTVGKLQYFLQYNTKNYNTFCS